MQSESSLPDLLDLWLLGNAKLLDRIITQQYAEGCTSYDGGMEGLWNNQKGTRCEDSGGSAALVAAWDGCSLQWECGR